MWVGQSVPQTILIVDDEASDLETIARVLTDAGYDVLTASDGRRAEMVASSHPGKIDLLVADVAMSPINGCQLARDLLQHERDLKVLFVSGFTGAQIITQQGFSEDMGADFMRKPVDGDALLAKVRKLLGARGSSSRIGLTARGTEPAA